MAEGPEAVSGADPEGKAQATSAGGTGMPFSTPVLIPPDELIRYIKEGAAEQASAAARERLNFFFTVIGLFLAIATAIAAGTLFSIQDQITKSVTEKVDSRLAQIEAAQKATLDKLSADLQAAVDLKLKGVQDSADQTRAELQTSLDKTKADLQAEAQSTRAALLADAAQTRTDLAGETRSMIKDQTTDIVLIPLLAAEANSFALKRGYKAQDRNRIISVLQRLAPEIAQQQGDVQEITLKKITEIIDAFSGAGDDSGVLTLYETFKDLLPMQPLLYDQVCWAFTRSMLSDRDFLRSHGAALDEILDREYNIFDVYSRQSHDIVSLTRQFVDQSLPPAEIGRLLTEAERDSPGMIQIFYNIVMQLQKDAEPTGAYPSAFGRDETARVLAGLELALPKPVPETAQN